LTVTVLGSGTSTGVPIVACRCKVCTSDAPENKRLRAAMLLTSDAGNVLIDTGPDLRYQMLRTGTAKLSAVLYTHFHYDHLAGLDDLKPFTFDHADQLLCYANIQTHEIILGRYPYIRDNISYTTVPRLKIEVLPGNEEDGYQQLDIAGMQIQPIRMLHIPKAGVLSTGFVVNGEFGYLTDFKEIHPNDEKYLYGLKVLYLGSPIDKLHVSHISHPEGLDLIRKFKPERGVIGHLSHQHLHSELTAAWQGVAEPAHDGMQFKF
jgi:phosphoribosyl 1,2-cyclic phosphate phosphodiesterase